MPGLLVTHWAVETNAATRLTMATFDLLRTDPAQACRGVAARHAGLPGRHFRPDERLSGALAPFEMVGEGR
jgi:hypothetical protein